MPKVEIKQVVTTRFAVGDKVFDDPHEAHRHASVEGLANLVREQPLALPLEVDDVPYPEVRAPRVLAEWIVDHFDEIHEIMRGYPSCRDSY